MRGIPITELAEDIKRSALNSLAVDKSFDCRCCGERFTPEDNQWIFYNLCDTCFCRFDRQKTELRFGISESGYESCDAWIYSCKSI